jgi:hypothetical protein
MTSELYEDNDNGNLLVKINKKIIANYPLTTLKLLKENFKDICSTQEFSDDYTSLDDFVNSIYFLEFLEYFLYYLHRLKPDLILYEKYMNKIKNLKSRHYVNPIFNSLMKNSMNYLFNEDLKLLFNNVESDYKKLIIQPIFDDKELFIRLYLGFLYFLKSYIQKGKFDDAMTNLLIFKHNLSQGKLTKKHKMFKKSSLSMINKSFSDENMIKLRKNLLYKFRLFQRKYISKIAKFRRIGPPNATNNESREIKKELNKNKIVDYKAYEIFCKYVLSKEENEDIYDFLAGIHKNNNGSVIHKNINNNTVANIKANTKKKHHIEYVEKSEKILKIVESKIKEHGDIIDSKTKSQVERIRKLFDSQQFKNMTLSFGNDNASSIGGKIIQDCKTIRIINKEIDKMIKQEKQRKQEQEKEKQEKEEKKQDKKTRRKQDKRNFISNLAKNNSNIQKENNLEQIIKKLLSKYTNKLKNKTLTDLERKKTLEIIQRLEAYKNSNL